MIVLGADPGKRFLGIAIANVHAQRAHSLRSFTVRLPADRIEMLQAVPAVLDDACSKHDIELACVEKQWETFMAKMWQGLSNDKSGHVSLIEAAIVTWATCRSIRVSMVTPQQVKSAVCRSGSASKAQVAAAVRLLVGSLPSELTEHEADAHAIVIAGERRDRIEGRDHNQKSRLGRSLATT